METNPLLGKVSRVVAILILLFPSFFFIISPLVLIDPSLRNPIEIINTLLSFVFGLALIYCISILVRNRKALFLRVVYILSAVLIYTTIRGVYSFITTQSVTTEDLVNLILNLAFYSVPALLTYISYKIEPEKQTLSQVQDVKSTAVSKPEPFTPNQYQGIFVRGFAQIVDQIIIILPLIGLASLLGQTSDEWRYRYTIIAGILLLIYFIVTEAFWSQTIGKRLLNIRVAMVDGRPLTVKAAILRNLGRIVDVALGGYLLGILVMVFTRKKQRVGDLIARTVVVK